MRKDCIAAILQESKLSNSPSTISLRGQIVFVLSQLLQPTTLLKNMQVNTVGVEYRREFNLGGYESLELGITLYGKVDPDEDSEGVAQLL